MSTFFICICILLASPSLSSVASTLSTIAEELRKIRASIDAVRVAVRESAK